MTPRGLRENIQEQEYSFPYHYSDLFCPDGSPLWGIERRGYFSVLRKLLAPFRGQRILDAGCGDGRFCYEMRNCRVKIVGVDSSPRAIAYARAFNPDADFFVSDLAKLNLPYKFDQIILLETLEHIPPPKIRAILDNLKRHLADEGKLIVSVPSKKLHLYKKHYQHFTKDSLAKALFPSLQVDRVIGYGSHSAERKFFWFLWVLGYIFSPLWRFIPQLKRFYDILEQYYQARLAVGDPDNCSGIIAVCSLRVTG